jgi:hypothetical protein
VISIKEKRNHRALAVRFLQIGNERLYLAIPAETLELHVMYSNTINNITNGISRKRETIFSSRNAASLLKYVSDRIFGSPRNATMMSRRD